MKHQAVAVAMLVLVLALGAVPGGGAIHKIDGAGAAESVEESLVGAQDGGGTTCNARSQDTIRVGVGSILNGNAMFHGITYVDLHYPACSSGRFELDPDSGNVITEQFCESGFLRVYAPIGGAGESFIINWKDHEAGPCR